MSAQRVTNRVWAYGLVVALLPASAVAQQDGDGALQYRWQPGQSFQYRVTVEGDMHDYTDVYTGTPTLTVISADADQITLQFLGTLTPSRKMKEAARIPVGPPRATPFSPLTGVGAPFQLGGSQLTINRRGEVVRMTGSSQLPFLLGNLSQLFLEILPAGNEKSWKASREVVLSRSDRRIPRPRFLANDESLTKAAEETSYALEQRDQASATISKTYSLRSATLVNGEPEVEVAGRGRIVFDLKQSAPHSLDYEQKITTRDGNTTVVVPVKVTFEIIDEAERKRLAAEATRPLNDDERDQVLADLTSGEPRRFLKQFNQLAARRPNNPNPEVARALAEFLKHENDSYRYSAAKALENWAIEETTPDLLKALDDSFPIVRHAAMRSLGRMQVTEAAEPIAERLTQLPDRLEAGKALQLLGPAAEEAVLKQLKHDDWQVRNEAVKVLTAIGTERSVPSLKQLQINDANALVRRTAAQAIDAIQKRQKIGPRA